MAGSKMGSIKRKLGLKGKTKPGEMISKMNAIKAEEKSEKKLSPKAYAKHEKNESPKHKKLEEKVMGVKHSTIEKKANKAVNGIKKSGKSFGKSNKLGGGGRFAQVEHKVAGKKGVYNPAGLAAYIGRKSLGKAKFQKLAAAGKKRA